MARTFKISLLSGKRSNDATMAELSLEDLVANLTRYHAQETKDGPSWSPIVWADGKRASDNFESASALVYDLDWDKREDREDLMDALGVALEREGVAYVIHETYTANRYRLVIPLAHDLHARNYQDVLFQMRDRLGLTGTEDESAVDLARLFFLPAHPPGETRTAAYEPGKLYDPGVMMRLYGTMPDLVPPAPSAGPIDLSAINGNAELKKALAGRLKIPVGERHDTLFRLIGELTRQNTHLAKDWASAWPVVEAILLRCCEGVSGDWIAEAETDCYRSWKDLAPQALVTQGMKTIIDVVVPEPVAADKAWETQLQLDKAGAPKANAFNAGIILGNHPAFKGFIRFNELLRRSEVLGGALYLRNPEGRNTHEGNLDFVLRTWLEQHYHISVDQRTCGAAILAVAKRNSYNPVRDYLWGLEWDGTPRVEDALMNFCHCTGNLDYIRAISTKFFVGAVARALMPGCKVDTVLVLRGPQGTGKTSFIEALAGEWYTTCSGRVDNKDTVLQATESWFVELSELSSMSKSSVEQMRGFITLREDRIRIPYATYTEAFPRRCVFVGTTNDERPLIDSEGNRRYWVVEAGEINIPGIRKWRDQLFAEAVEMLAEFNRGNERFRWWFTPEEQKISDAENELFLAEDVLQAAVDDWTQYELDRPERMTMAQVIRQVCKLQPERVMNERGIMKRIRSCLRKAKWVEKRLARGPTVFVPPAPESTQ